MDENINKRKQAEEQEYESQINYKLLFERNLAAVYITTLDGSILECNEAFALLLGYKSPDEIKKHNTNEFYFDNNDRKTFISDLKKKGSLVNYEGMLKHKNGLSVRILENVSLLNYDDKQSVIQGTVIDITERKKMQMDHDRMFNLSIDMMCIAGFDGYFKQLNPAWEKTLGWKNEELMAKPYIEFVHPDDLELTMNAASGLSEGKTVITFNNRYLCKNGAYKWISWNSYPIVAEKLIFAIARDITEQKQSENEMLKAREQLSALASHLQTVREEEKRLIARELHDDLGQKLTVIKIDVANLSANFDIGKKHTKNILSLIDDSIDSVQHITKTLRPPILDDLGLVPALKWLLKDFKKHTSIDYNLTTNADEILVAPKVSLSIFRIIQELLTNITRHSKATSVDILITKQMKNLFISIEDNGIGISEENINRPDAFGIIGIKERIMSCNGSINISGTKKAGTKIEIKIPLGNNKND